MTPRQWWIVLTPDGRAMCTCESKEGAEQLAQGYSNQNDGKTFPIVRVREMTEGAT